MEAHACFKFPDDESDPFSEVPGESHDTAWWNFTLWKVEGKKSELFQIYIYIHIYKYIRIYTLECIYICIYYACHFAYMYTREKQTERHIHAEKNPFAFIFPVLLCRYLKIWWSNSSCLFETRRKQKPCSMLHMDFS